MRVAPFWVLVALLAFFGGCAGANTANPVFNAPSASFAAPEFSGRWLFRHTATLTVPEKDFTVTFTGMMRLDADAGIAHIVALGGMGLTFLDMTATRDATIIRHMHPAVARVRGAADCVTATIRSLWLTREAQSPVLTAGWSGGDVKRFGPWPEKALVAGNGFSVIVTLLEARKLDDASAPIDAK